MIGSQAIVGSHPELSGAGNPECDAIAGSLDLDVMPLDGSDRWVHELSWMTEGGVFADSNGGAHADPVAEGVATLPPGWRDRLLCIETPNMLTPAKVQARAWVLEPHDLLASKYVAARENDYAFCEAVIRTGIVDQAKLLDRLQQLAATFPDTLRRVEIARSKIAKAFASRSK